MKKKIFTSLATVTLLLSSGAFTGLAQADSVSDTVQPNTTQSSIPRGNDILSEMDDQKAATGITINPYHFGDKNLTGHLSSNSIDPSTFCVIAVYAADGSALYGRTNIFPDNDFSMKMNDQSLPVGTELEIIVQDHSTGHIILTAYTTVLGDHAELPSPVVNQPIHEGDTVVTGTGHKAGDTINITNDNGTQIGSSTVKSDLSFAVKIPSQVAYTTLHVVETDGTSTSDSTDVIVHEKSSSELSSPTVDTVYEGDTLLTGKGSKVGDKIIVTNDGGTTIGAGTVDLDLSFTVAILPQSAYTTLHVVEKNGTSTSDPTNVIVHEAHKKLN